MICEAVRRGLRVGVTAVSHKVIRNLLEATLRSAASLGPDRRFRIIFWNKSSSQSFPATGLSAGDADSIESARSALANVVAYGATEPIGALTDALGLRPDRIVLVTAKSSDLDDDTASKRCLPPRECRRRLMQSQLGDRGRVRH